MVWKVTQILFLYFSPMTELKESCKNVSIVSWPVSEEVLSVEDHRCVPHLKGRNRRISKFRIKFTFWWGLALLVGIKDAFWNWCLSLQSVSPIRRHFQRESVQNIWTNKAKQNKHTNFWTNNRFSYFQQRTLISSIHKNYKGYLEVFNTISLLCESRK